jgi:hypothetical protein
MLPSVFPRANSFPDGLNLIVVNFASNEPSYFDYPTFKGNLLIKVLFGKFSTTKIDF